MSGGSGKDRMLAARAAMEGAVVETRERMRDAGRVETTLTISLMLNSASEPLEDMAKTLAMAESMGLSEEVEALLEGIKTVFSTLRDVLEFAETRLD